MTDFPARSAAVLFGLSYPLDDALDASPLLKAPPRDVEHMETMLRLHNLNDITMITDEPVNPSDQAWQRCSTQAITAQLAGLVGRTVSENLDFALFYFSGHGTSIPIPEGEDSPMDENPSMSYVGSRTRPGANEALVGTNLTLTGPLMDNTIRSMLESANPNTWFVLIFDCCNSHTMADLQFEYYTTSVMMTNKKVRPLNASIVTLSGCLDLQLSDEDDEGYDWFWPVSPTFRKMYDNYNYTTVASTASRLVPSGGMTGALYTMIMGNSESARGAFPLLSSLQQFVAANVDASQTPCMSSSSMLNDQSIFFPLNYVSESRTNAYNFAKGLLHSYTANIGNTVLSTLLTACNRRNLDISSITNVANALSSVGSLPAPVADDRLSWIFAIAFATQAVCNALDTCNDGFWKSSDPNQWTILKMADSNSFLATDMQQAGATSIPAYLTTKQYISSFTTMLGLAANSTKLNAISSLLLTQATQKPQTLLLFSCILKYGMRRGDYVADLVSALQGLYLTPGVNTSTVLKSIAGYLATMYTSTGGASSIAKDVYDVVVAAAGSGITFPATTNGFVLPLVSSAAYIGRTDLPAALKAVTVR